MKLFKICSFSPLIAAALFALNLSTQTAQGIAAVPEAEEILGLNGKINALERDNLDGTISYGFKNVSGGVITLEGIAVSTNDDPATIYNISNGNEVFSNIGGGDAAYWNTNYGTLGSFVKLFGADRYVHVFLNPIGTGTFSPGGPHHLATFGALPATEFVAWDSAGVVDQSRPVPDTGSTVLLLGAGLLGLAAIRRRMGRN